MKRTIIIGCPGSGKSTFARKLKKITNLPLYYLDMLWHNPDKTTITIDEFDIKLKEILEKEKWIIDGNYQRTLEMRLEMCDTVFLFELPLEKCLSGVEKRIGQKREDMPWVEDEFDKDFKEYICNFSKDRLPQIYEILEKYKKDKNIIIFKTRDEADEYLNLIQQKQDILNIQTPEDVFNFMNKYIEYGWIDINGEKHVKTMKDFRKLYKTMSIEEIFKYRVGTCIEQVWLMHFLLDKINIKNKMFCCRIFEPDNYNNLEEEEHMHCFVLYYMNDKVYHIEHPNFERKGIYEYNTEKDALNAIINYYIKLRGGKESPTKEFYQVKSGLTFKEFNKYINNIKESDYL